MRRFPLTAAALVALACAACSKETAKAPPTPVEAAGRPVAAEPPPPPPPPSDTAASATPPAAPAPEPAPVAAAQAPPPERVVTYVPAKERRIRALLNNAISRDVTGETERAAAVAEARRAACKTQACVDRSYAGQEAALRKWEGSEAIR